MTQLEERLRRGMKDYSERVGPGSVQPLREPARGRRSEVMRWLAAATAVVAVISVIAAVSLAAGQHPRRSDDSAPPARGMPPYYVTVYWTHTDHGKKTVTRAVVHDSATGAALASVLVPTAIVGGGAAASADISAAADDRTFVIYEAGAISSTDFLNWMFLLHVSGNGRSVTLRRMRINVPRTIAVSYVALSPDGRMLAMQEQSCDKAGCQHFALRVVNIASGSVRTWSTRQFGEPDSVSWAGNKRVVFLWDARWADPGTDRSGGTVGYRMLDLTGQGGNLLASTPIASPPHEPSGQISTELATADGRTVFTSSVRNIPNGHGTDTVVAKIIELDAHTGKLLRVLRTVTVHAAKVGMNSAFFLDQDCYVLSLAPSGVHLLIACYAFGRLDGNVFTPLPGFPSLSSDGDIPQTTGAW
jgi:hypothetical protein